MHLLSSSIFRYDGRGDSGNLLFPGVDEPMRRDDRQVLPTKM